MTRAARKLPRGSTRLPPMVAESFGHVESLAEAVLLNRLRMLGLPEPQTQVQLIPHRKFRYDAVWGDPYRVCVELQGGVWDGGRHVRGSGYENDCTKLALAQLEGYLVIYVTPRMVESGVGGFLIVEALKARGWRQ